MKSRITAALAASAIFATPALHAADEKAQPAAYKAVLDCRAIADAAQRLACFDSAVGNLAAADAKSDIVVLDREAMRENRRGLFGLNLSKVKLFGAGDDDVEEVTGRIARIAGQPGRQVFTLDDGAVWQQIDGRAGFAEVGDSIRIRKAALGSFKANIDNAVAVRVKRLGGE